MTANGHAIGVPKANGLRVVASMESNDPRNAAVRHHQQPDQLVLHWDSAVPVHAR